MTISRGVRWGVTILIGCLALVHQPAQAGTYAAEFLRIGVGARAIAMGGAFTALANDGTAFYWNPAGLTCVHRAELTFEHAPLFGGMAHYNVASLAVRLIPALTVGVGWIRLGVEDIPRYGPLQETRWDRFTNPALRSTGEPEGYFQDSENALLLSFARRMDFEVSLGVGLARVWIPAELSLGANFKYLEQRLDTFAGRGEGLDAGLLLRLMSESMSDSEPQRTVSVGLSVHDLSRTSMRWNTPSGAVDRAGAVVRSGVAICQTVPFIRSQVTLALDREWLSARAMYFGGELRVRRAVALRAGSNDGQLAVGAGLRLGRVQVDYAFVSYQLRGTHRVSAAFRF
ncbi:MAG: UPF0164 family protein [candidate division KSB1 bacterium]|nr:UPF0164 family protein [candidate division KSB1 bacterium]